MTHVTHKAAISSPFVPRPLAPDCVRAGFPSPAQDYEEETLDINRYLIRNAASTYFVQVEGDSMDGAGIHHGDILVVDRSIKFRNGHIVIAFVGGERLVKRLSFEGTHGFLMAENPAYPPIRVDEEHPATIWGVVTGRFAKIPA